MAELKDWEVEISPAKVFEINNTYASITTWCMCFILCNLKDYISAVAFDFKKKYTNHIMYGRKLHKLYDFQNYWFLQLINLINSEVFETILGQIVYWLLELLINYWAVCATIKKNK